MDIFFISQATANVIFLIITITVFLIGLIVGSRRGQIVGNHIAVKYMIEQGIVDKIQDDDGNTCIVSAKNVNFECPKCKYYGGYDYEKRLVYKED